MGQERPTLKMLGKRKRAVEGREQKEQRPHPEKQQQKDAAESRVTFWWKNPRLPRGSALRPRTTGIQGILYQPVIPWGLSSVCLAAPQEHQCRFGEKKWGIRQERACRMISGPMAQRCSLHRALQWSSPTSSPIWLRKCKYKKGTLKLEIKEVIRSSQKNDKGIKWCWVS